MHCTVISALSDIMHCLTLYVPVCLMPRSSLCFMPCLMRLPMPCLVHSVLHNLSHNPIRHALTPVQLQRRAHVAAFVHSCQTVIVLDVA